MTNEQLEELRWQVKHHQSVSHVIAVSVTKVNDLFAHIDAQAARIAELEAAPKAAVATGWIDPNDKTQKQFLPYIGETVLFCHDGVTYYGVHTGGSFKTGQGVTARFFDTWRCWWMYPPKAAGRDGEL